MAKVQQIRNSTRFLHFCTLNSSYSAIVLSTKALCDMLFLSRDPDVKGSRLDVSKKRIQGRFSESRIRANMLAL